MESAGSRSRSGVRSRLLRAVLVAISLGTLALGAAAPPHPPASAAGPCDTPSANPIPCENSRPGAPDTEWAVDGNGDPSIQGYATDISVGSGQTVHFKIKTPASSYHLDIYRLGYYGGPGRARWPPSSPRPPSPSRSRPASRTPPPA